MPRTVKRTSPTPTPSLVSLPGEVGAPTQIAAGENHSLAVTSSGQLYAFGANRSGQLGSAANTETDKATSTPALVALMPGTTIDTDARGSNAHHSLAIVSGLAITSSTLPAGQLGSPYVVALSAAGRHRAVYLVCEGSSRRGSR